MTFNKTDIEHTSNKSYYQSCLIKGIANGYTLITKHELTLLALFAFNDITIEGHVAIGYILLYNTHVQ